MIPSLLHSVYAVFFDFFFAPCGKCRPTWLPQFPHQPEQNICLYFYVVDPPSYIFNSNSLSEASWVKSGSTWLSMYVDSCWTEAGVGQHDPSYMFINNCFLACASYSKGTLSMTNLGTLSSFAAWSFAFLCADSCCSALIQSFQVLRFTGKGEFFVHKWWGWM